MGYFWMQGLYFSLQRWGRDQCDLVETGDAVGMETLFIGIVGDREVLKNQTRSLKVLQKTSDVNVSL